VTSQAIVIVVGPAGSGKSTVAREIAQRYSALYLDKDSMVGDLVSFCLESNGYRSDDRESNAFYRERLMPLEYRSMLRVAGENLRLGASVVLDAPFAAYLDCPGFIEGAALDWPPVSVIVARVRVAESTVRQRLIARGNLRDKWKLDNWTEFWATYGVTECLWSGSTTIDVRNDDSTLDWASLDVAVGSWTSRE